MESRVVHFLSQRKESASQLQVKGSTRVKDEDDLRHEMKNNTNYTLPCSCADFV